MNFMEEVKRMLQMQRELFFVEKMFSEFPDAEIYLVGGTVRDILLKHRTTGSDIDLVVCKLPREKLERWLSDEGRVDFVGKTFGVYKFIPTGVDADKTHPIDIALPRTEQAFTSNRGGDKEFVFQSDENLSISEDLARRDFTMNAMAINLQTGDLIDPFDGARDIRTKIIRAVGNPTQRFEEDLSRLLRAIRFSAQLHFEIERETREAITILASKINDHRDPINRADFIVSRESIGAELAKGFFYNPSGMVDSLIHTNLFSQFFDLESDTNSIRHMKDGQPTLATTLLLRHLTQDKIHSVLSLTGLDSLPRGTPFRIEPADVLWLTDRLNQNFTPESVTQLRASAFEKYFLNGRTNRLLGAMRAVQNTASADTAEDRATEIRTRWSVEPDESIPPLLSGNDFLSAGFHPGPNVRALLESLRDEQLEGNILTREQAQRWLKTKIL